LTRLHCRLASVVSKSYSIPCSTAHSKETHESIRLSKHAEEQVLERGATEAEVKEAVRKGSREPAENGREMCRYNFAFNRKWQGKHYAIKQVAVVIKEEADETVVITVYTFYF
jgi:hypothetical protein